MKIKEDIFTAYVIYSDDASELICILITEKFVNLYKTKYYHMTNLESLLKLTDELVSKLKKEDGYASLTAAQKKTKFVALVKGSPLAYTTETAIRKLNEPRHASLDQGVVLKALATQLEPVRIEDMAKRLEHEHIMPDSAFATIGNMIMDGQLDIDNGKIINIVKNESTEDVWRHLETRRPGGLDAEF